MSQTVQHAGPETAPAELPSPERIQELFFAAARMGRDDMIPGLILAGAELEARDAKGYTPLIIASYNGQATTTELLIGLGAQVDGADDQRGNTALMGISFKGYPVIARALIEAGADVNARNFVGQTALMTAVLFNQVAIVDMLMEAGADATVADLNGVTVLGIAQAQGTKAMVQRFGAEV